MFWEAMSAVFHAPRRLQKCGSHVHVSPSRGAFRFSELKAIAFAVFFYDGQVQKILPANRRKNHYCYPNKKHSPYLYHKKINQVLKSIKNTEDKKELVKIVQGLSKKDRPLLWNFHNITRMPFATEKAIGTVEFRGGKYLRGPAKTKRWISFAVAFVVLAIQEVTCYTKFDT